MATTVYSCVQSKVCTFSTACATNTYTVGQEPTSTPTLPVNAVVFNGGFETANTARWVFSSPLNQPFDTLGLTTLRSHNGSASLRADFPNTR